MGAWTAHSIPWLSSGQCCKRCCLQARVRCRASLLGNISLKPTQGLDIRCWPVRTLCIVYRCWASDGYRLKVDLRYSGQPVWYSGSCLSDCSGLKACFNHRNSGSHSLVVARTNCETVYVDVPYTATFLAEATPWNVDIITDTASIAQSGDSCTSLQGCQIPSRTDLVQPASFPYPALEVEASSTSSLWQMIP